MFPDPTIVWKAHSSILDGVKDLDVTLLHASRGSYVGLVAEMTSLATDDSVSSYTVRFLEPLAWFGIDETFYSVGSLGRDEARGPGCHLRIAEASSLKSSMQELASMMGWQDPVQHFLLAGLDTCLEVVCTGEPESALIRTAAPLALGPRSLFVSSPDMRWRGGGCHCGAVRFEAQLPDRVEAQDCTCSICAMTGFRHVIVPESRFRLTQGSDRLTTYTFNTGVARHLFCSTCGVKSFYRPRSNPDGWSINARCLDEATAPAFDVTLFDGREWEAHAAELAHLSRDEA